MAKWNLKGDQMDIEVVLFKLNDIIHAKDPKDEAVKFKRDIVRIAFPIKTKKDTEQMEKPTFRYILDRLNEIKTQSDLEALKSDVEDYLPLDKFEEDFDVNTAVDNLKRDYVNRALNKVPTLHEAADLLGLKSYQVLVNWIKRLDIKHD